MIPKELNSEMLIADVIKGWPQVIPVFIQLHMACIGCDMAAFCTLEEAAGDYHLPVDQFMSRLQQAITLQSPSL